MNLFWTYGYEGTSLKDLTAALEINKPSLYAAFGSKEELFRQAVSLYDETESRAVAQALDAAPTAREAVARFLRANVEAYTDAEKPNGCMIVLAAMIGTPQNAAVRDHLAMLREETREMLRARLDRAVAAGELPADTDCPGLAAFHATILHGLSIEARDGATRRELMAIVDRAMAGWDAAVASNRCGDSVAAGAPQTAT